MEYLNKWGTPIKIVLMILSLCFTSGFLGAWISSGIEWGRIRYDYSNKKDENKNAYALYVVSMLSWVFPLCSVVTTILYRLFKNFEWLKLSNIFLFISFLCGTATLCVMLTCLNYSMPKKCEEIRETGTPIGSESSKFKDYMNGKLEGVKEEDIESTINDFNKSRCEHFNKLMWIFLGMTIISFIITLIITVSVYFYTTSVDHNPELEDDTESLTENDHIEENEGKEKA